MCVIEFHQHTESLCSVRAGQKVLELVVLDLARTILVNVLNQFLNVNGHLEFLLDDANQLRGINGTITIGLTTHSYKGIKSIFFVSGGLILFLLSDNMLELSVRDFARIFCVSLSNHAENFFFSGLLSHHF